MKITEKKLITAIILGVVLTAPILLDEFFGLPLFPKSLSEFFVFLYIIGGLIVGLFLLVSTGFIIPFNLLGGRRTNPPDGEITKLHIIISFLPLVAVVSATFIAVSFSFIKTDTYNIPCDIYSVSESISYREKVRLANTIRTLAFMFAAALPILGLIASLGLYLKKRDIVMRLILLASFGFLVSLLLLVSLVLLSSNASRKSRDAKRISDVKQVQLALELYRDRADPKRYPAVSQWQNLESILVPDFMPAFPSDPCNGQEPSRQYMYQSSSDGTSYVIRSVLQDDRFAGLNSDIDGEVYGVWCGAQGKELEYCVMP